MSASHASASLFKVEWLRTRALILGAAIDNVISSLLWGPTGAAWSITSVHPIHVGLEASITCSASVEPNPGASAEGLSCRPCGRCFNVSVQSGVG